MEQPVRVGIIGFGFMGTTHYRIYRENPGARVAAIADVDLLKRQGDIHVVTGNIGGGDNSQPLDLAGCKTYADGMELIADPEVDLVDICVPVFLHKKYALAALAAGKHVLCEKPLSMTAADAAEIVAAARTDGKAFMVGMCVRYWPEYRYVREQYRAGAFGRVRQAFFKRFSPTVNGNGWQNWFADRDKSGGALLEMHLHDTDQILYFFGRPQRVTTAGCRGVRSRDCWDHVFTTYDYGDGSLIVAEGGWTAAKGTPFEMSFQLICERATVMLNHAGLNIYYEDGRQEKPALPSGASATGWHEELNYLIAAIRSGQPANRFMTPPEIIDGLCIVEAERQSAETQQTINVTYQE